MKNTASLPVDNHEKLSTGYTRGLSALPVDNSQAELAEFMVLQDYNHKPAVLPWYAEWPDDRHYRTITPKQMELAFEVQA